MLSRSALKAMARMALIAVLFTQAAIAIAACESVRRAPALALAELQLGDAGCHEQPGNVNLCLAHCLGEDQSLDKPQLKVPALYGALALAVPAPIVSLHDARPIRYRSAPPACAPPPRILYHSFLI